MDMRRIAGTQVDIASLTGRYYGMDRDRRWDRTKLAYDAMVHGIGTPVEHPVLAVQAAYQRGETDEFIQPLVHHPERGTGRHDARRRRGAVLQLSQRPDAPDRGARSRSTASTGFDLGDRPELSCVTMTQYDQTFPIPQAFPPFSLARILARGPGGTGPDPVPYRGDREVSPRHLLLQRRLRAAVPGRGALSDSLPAGRDLRSGAGDERRGHHRRALPHDREREPRLHSLQLRQRRHGGAHGRAAGGDQGGGDGGPVPGAGPRQRGQGRVPASSSPPITATAR